MTWWTREHISNMDYEELCESAMEAIQRNELGYFDAVFDSVLEEDRSEFSKEIASRYYAKTVKLSDRVTKLSADLRDRDKTLQAFVTVRNFLRDL